VTKHERRLEKLQKLRKSIKNDQQNHSPQAPLYKEKIISLKKKPAKGGSDIRVGSGRCPHHSKSIKETQDYKIVQQDDSILELGKNKSGTTKARKRKAGDKD